jgi:hypothetical protein
LLGNLLPGQIARIEIQMIKPLTIEAGAFEFVIPVSFMPQYKSHELVQNFHQPNEWYTNESQKEIAEILPEYFFGYKFEVK